MKPFFTQHNTRRFTVFVLLLLLVLAILLLKSIDSKNSSRRALFASHRRRPVSPDDVTRISGWMTFEYVNTLFDLPDTYLKDTLHIQDEKYPLLTIKQYTQKNRIDTVTFLTTLKEQIDVYIHKPRM